MDKKYKAIPTIKQLNLSASPKSVSFDSVKSSFSTQSKEDKFNKAYANDFSGSSSSGSSEAGAKMKNPKTPLLLKPQKLPPLEGKVRNPLTGRMIDANGSVHKKLLKEGKMSKDTSPMGAKQGLVVSEPKPETEPDDIDINERRYGTLNHAYYGTVKYIIENFEKDGINGEPLHPTQREIMKSILNGVSKVIKRLINNKYVYDELPSMIDTIFNMYKRKYDKDTYQKYISPLRYDGKNFTSFEGKLYEEFDIYTAWGAVPKKSFEQFKKGIDYLDNDKSYTPEPSVYPPEGERNNHPKGKFDYLKVKNVSLGSPSSSKSSSGSSSSEAGPNMKKYIEVMKQYSPKTDITAKKPPAKIIEAEAKMKKKYMEIRKQFSPKTDITTKNPSAKIMNPAKKNSPLAPITPPKKKRGRPKGSLNKPKPKPKSKSKSSSSSSSSGYNQSSPQFV